MTKYERGTFVVVPNQPSLRGKPSEMQAIYMWLCSYTDKHGCCFPSRKTLAQDAGCSLGTVDKYVAQLIEDGFIKKEFRKKEGSKQNLSNLYQIIIIDDIAHDLDEGATKNIPQGSTKNSAVTIPILNSTHLTKVLEAPTEVKKGTLPESMGKTYITRLLNVYNRLFRDKYGFAATLDMGRFGKSMKSLVQTKNEAQIAAMMIIFFNWKGMDGGDEFTHKKLIDNTFSPQWFASTINQYEAYLRNVFNLHLDNEVETLEFVRENLSKLST